MFANNPQCVCFNDNISTIYEVWIDGKFHKSFDNQQLAFAAYRLLNESNSFIRETCEIIRDYADSSR